MEFEKNVFINCPFDNRYRSLLRPLLFTIIYVGLCPRIALEVTDSGQARLEKIIGLIRESKYSIHDLSRIESASANELYRLNMPFELGMDFGCRHFGDAKLNSKKILILEVQPHRYKAALSDLAGCDIEAHEGKPYQVITAVRHWLKSTCKISAAGPDRIASEFTSFMADNYEELSAEGFSKADIGKLPIGELIERMQRWKLAR